VAVYLVVWRLPQWANAAIAAALVLLVYVPIRYVYPSRTKTWRAATLLLGVSWAALFLIMMWRMPAVDGPWMTLSLVFPLYYLGLSLWMTARDRAR
jgi:phosphatidylcholine synthase